MTLKKKKLSIVTAFILGTTMLFSVDKAWGKNDKNLRSAQLKTRASSSTDSTSLVGSSSETKSGTQQPQVQILTLASPSFAIVRDDIKGAGLTTPFSVKPTPKGSFKVTGEGILFYQLLSKSLMDTHVGQKFLLKAEVKSATPGGYLQYFDGNERVMSKPYPGGNQWKKLQLEFTVKNDSPSHIVYPLVMPPQKPGSKVPVVEIRNISLDFAS
ncbi:MAG: hypothetical protein K2Y08_04965 [Alphaproteobacteria bacterium]|nr:hypothetical protein [Alphaproteobacteria bacterium]